ncbi:MAG: response regulator [Bacteroidaceae bacterium]|nr:response regulator [Bacteroidaceae bacterium]
MKNSFLLTIGLMLWVLVIKGAETDKMTSVPFVSIAHFAADDESMQGRSTSIMQDSQGFIWVSSFNGLNRYDGYQWTKYKSGRGKNSVLATNRINNIVENSQGDIWCITVAGLYVFNKQQGQFYDIQPVLDSLAGHKAHATKIWPLKNGISWMQSEDGFVFRIVDRHPREGSRLVHFRNDAAKNGSSSSAFTEIYGAVLDHQGNEWVLTKQGSYLNGNAEPASKVVFRHIALTEEGPWFISSNGRQIAHYCNETLSFKEFLPENCRVYFFGIVGDSLLLTATNRGLYRSLIGGGSLSLLTSQDIHSVFLDSHGVLWGLSEQEGVLRLTSDDNYVHCRADRVMLPADLSDELLARRFHEDSDGQLWLLSMGNNDILYFDTRTNSFKRPYCRENLNSNTSSFTIDRQGNVWYQSERSVDMLSLHSCPFRIDNRFRNQEVRSQFIDSQNRHWYGLRENKVVVCDSNGTELQQFALPGTMYCIHETSDGVVWMGSRNDGLFRLTPEGNSYSISHFLHDDEDITSLSNNAIYTLCEDSRGHLWIGTFGGGVNLWDNGHFIHQQNRLGYNSEQPQTIRFVSEVKPGIIAIASREGLYTYSTDFSRPEDICMFHNAKRSNDDTCLTDNDITSVLMTTDGTLYVSTQSGGICRMITDNLLSNDIQFESISKEDGLASDVAYSIVEDYQGILWVSSERALSRLSADHKTITIYDNFSFPTEVVFSEGIPLHKGNELVFGTMQGTVSINPTELRTDIYVPPLVVDSHLASSEDDRSATLHFAALDYRNRRHLKYAYRMEGVDADWTTSSENSVTYVNLPPGKHLFHVRSTNADGQWTDNEQILPIYVKPRFYERFWGMLLILFAVFTLITLAVYEAMRLYRLRHSLTVEQELTDMKIRFFTDISHELRTPLTLVDGPVSEVLEDKSLSDQSRYYLEVVQRNVRRMLNLVNQILDFRKLQNHKMSLLIEPIDVRDTLSRIMENFNEMAVQHHMSFSLQASDNLPTLWADRDKIEKIFFNLLVNAFKYTDDGKSITINATQPTSDTIAISVSDQGIGIRKEDISKLFTRFETVLTDNTSRPSSGIGLSLVKQFSDLHHANVSVDSKVGEGSTFTITFRTGKDHFSNDKQVEFFAADTAHLEATDETSPVDLNDKNPLSELIGTEEDEEDERPKILIVEDNDELRDFIEHILSDTYRITLATDGEEGLRMGRELWPDLIITDIMMPVMDGFQMIQQIKEDADIYAVPIIVLTAKGTLDDRIHGVELGIDDYVLKPFSASYLKARVAALLEQRQRLRQRFMQMLSEGDKVLVRRSLEPDMPVITPADELFLQDVMAFMEKNMDNADITIDDFASAVKLGRTVFYNKLKATVGLTPIDFVQEMRIKRAVQLMKTDNFTISEIAYQTGFNDPKYFSRCFKKHLGETPTDYLKKLRAEKETNADS